MGGIFTGQSRENRARVQNCAPCERCNNSPYVKERDNAHAFVSVAVTASLHSLHIPRRDPRGLAISPLSVTLEIALLPRS